MECNFIGLREHKTDGCELQNTVDFKETFNSALSAITFNLNKTSTAIMNLNKGAVRELHFRQSSERFWIELG